MPIPQKQQEYFQKKTEEAFDDLRKVSALNRCYFPFFKEALIIPVPKINKVKSLDTWLNNVSNILKTAVCFSKFSVANAIQSSEYICQDHPIVSFCLDALASVIYHSVTALEQISDLISKKEQSDNAINMQAF